MKQSPARFMLRLPRDLHAQAVRDAAVNGVSLNTWITALVAAQQETLSEQQAQWMQNFVIAALGREKAAYWWQTPNPLLGNISPIRMMALGRARRLYQFVKAQGEGAELA